MSARTPTDPRLEGRLLYIEHLAQRLQAMEAGEVPIAPIAYRLYARRLRTAVAGCSEQNLATRLAGARTAVAETLAVRHFDEHGMLPGAGASEARGTADALLRRLRKPC
jgi:hypothetical protein